MGGGGLARSGAQAASVTPCCATTERVRAGRRLHNVAQICDGGSGRQADMLPRVNVRPVGHASGSVVHVFLIFLLAAFHYADLLFQVYFCVYLFFLCL